jgi:hypothetical protein
MARPDELEFELEDEMEYELEYERSGMVRGPLRIQIVDDRSRPGSREFEFEYEDEDEDELFDPAPPPRGAVLLTRFAYGSPALTAEHRRIIIPRLAAALLRIWPRDPNFCLNVSIVGHEDELGDPARYTALGRLRAQAVADELAVQLNRLAARIPAASRPKGRGIFAVRTAGPTRPIRSNVTAQGQALNRRVEVSASRPDVCRDVV